jgi:hypothetical protein
VVAKLCYIKKNLYFPVIFDKIFNNCTLKIVDIGIIATVSFVFHENLIYFQVLEMAENYCCHTIMSNPVGWGS